MGSPSIAVRNFDTVGDDVFLGFDCAVVIEHYLDGNSLNHAHDRLGGYDAAQPKTSLTEE